MCVSTACTEFEWACIGCCCAQCATLSTKHRTQRSTAQPRGLFSSPINPPSPTLEGIIKYLEMPFLQRALDEGKSHLLSALGVK